MPVYKAPLRDIKFVLHELLDIDTHYKSIPGADELTPDLIDAMIGETAKFIENVIAPLNHPGDEEGCHWSPEGVKTPKGFKEAYAQYCEQGILSMAHHEEHGGQGLPPSMGIVASELMGAANTSFSMYPGLSSGAMAAIEAHGSDEQKQAYLPKMNSGEWSGTMCLTESHCGTDLGLLRTKATPQDDGTFKVDGEKIFISAGDHDLTDNIIHLVLARLPDAPAGTKGISLFIVPKVLINEDGSLGERNGVVCSSIEHKMGINGSATCVLNFEDATGYLIGQPNKGLRAMFTMMNVARLGTGMQGMAMGELSRQGALEYAKDRLQMRALTGPKFPDKPADPIIVHPDVRRMLLTQKAFSEGARALAHHCGMLADITMRKAGTDEAEAAESEMELLTPIAKAFMSDSGSESANLGMQVFGGHGYVREHGMEQIVRDARIMQIYEGANGIQALDLLGRKVLATGGARLKAFTDQIDAFCEAQKGDDMKEYVDALRLHTEEWNGLVQKILERAMTNPDEAGAASYDFLSYSGYVVYAFFFARAAAISQKALADGKDDAAFYRSKLATARFYFRRLLPRTRGLVQTMLSGADDLMSLDAEDFGY
ncbi:MAG: acyl-CoA dehydrogenase C-terminal domain-containing protein [Myxococcales bacterium]|nr:acyl-CoA dehydrogenase C-terminal domain-containing protein [Myxococcales bacterium]